MRSLKPAIRRIAWLTAVVCPSALAHVVDGGDNRVPGWTFDAGITVPLLASAVLFCIGWMRLRRRSHQPARSHRQGLLFAAGWIVVAAALVSPLHAAGERSFAAHMFEHELLMLLGAPLLVSAEPLVTLLWALPAPIRRLIGKLLTSRIVRALWSRATGPLTATAVQAAILWLWHAPALFDLALASDGWHIAQHVSFFASALLFWTAILHHRLGRGATRSDNSIGVVCLIATSIVSGALGALMAFSQSPWYAGYAQLGMAPMGLTPVEDQQVAGLLMWIPGGLVHAGVALALVGAMLRPGPVEVDGAPDAA